MGGYEVKNLMSLSKDEQINEILESLQKIFQDIDIKEIF